MVAFVRACVCAVSGQASKRASVLAIVRVFRCAGVRTWHIRVYGLSSARHGDFQEFENDLHQHLILGHVPQ